nr:class I SAM-dependent methyltransferase [Lutimaribacter sp. EGI FJ00013]
MSLARDAGLFAPADAGDIAVFGAIDAANLDDLPREAVLRVSSLKTDHDECARTGLRAALQATETTAQAIVVLPRAKVLARGLIARALAVANGRVIVDGQKTDGIDSILKDCRKRGQVDEVIAKAHGKLFLLQAGVADFADWALPDTPQEIAGGFVTLPGVFSADGVDPASNLLAGALPKTLGKTVADLGAGWGYLARVMLERPEVTELHLVENDHSALDCARRNVDDPRARFHWDDATTWRPERALDAVVMNPPFHSGRAADPGLGQSFIASAAACLAPHGRLWLVANRHLPYEAALQTHFAQVDEIAGDNRFKVLSAHRPTRNKGRHRIG